MTGFRAFTVLWSGQLVALTGANLTGFALGVYIFQQTGSVTALGFIHVLTFLVRILASPFAGSLVDRWGAWRALLVANAGAVAGTLILAALFLTGTFSIWPVCFWATVSAVLRALDIPAFESSVPLLVPKWHIGRANGMRILALATSEVLAPIAAGFLLLVINIYGVVLMSSLSYSFALLPLLRIRIPRVPRRDETGSGRTTLLRDFGQAWRYVVARRGLLDLLLFIGALNFCAGFVDLLITPMVLSFDSADALGTVLSIGALGMVGGSIAMGVWGGRNRRVKAILSSSLVMAVATVLGSLRPSVVLITIAGVLFLATVPIVIGCNQAIWQTKTEPHLLGRVMALQYMCTNTPMVLAYGLAGVAADRIFAPLVGRDHVRSHVLTVLIGNGPGRGIALLLMVMGGLIAVCVAIGSTSRRLRHLEEELPDRMSAEEELPEGNPLQPRTSAQPPREEPAPLAK